MATAVLKKHQTAAIQARTGRVGFVPSKRVDHLALHTDKVTPAAAFAVFGAPAPQGSKKGFISASGKVGLKEMSEGLDPWRAAVRTAAMQVTKTPGWTAINEPVLISATFVVPWTAAAKKRGDVFLVSTPDLDKLQRSIGDAISPRPATNEGMKHLPEAMQRQAKAALMAQARRFTILHDDSVIVAWGHVKKVYPGTTSDALNEPGVFIEVWRIADIIDPIGSGSLARATVAQIMELTSPAGGSWQDALADQRSRPPVPLRAITPTLTLSPDDTTVVTSALFTIGPNELLGIAPKVAA